MCGVAQPPSQRARRARPSGRGRGPRGQSASYLLVGVGRRALIGRCRPALSERCITSGRRAAAWTRLLPWRACSRALQVPPPCPQGRPRLPRPTCGFAQGTVVLPAGSLHVPRSARGIGTGYLPIAPLPRPSCLWDRPRYPRLTHGVAPSTLALPCGVAPGTPVLLAGSPQGTRPPPSSPSGSPRIIRLSPLPTGLPAGSPGCPRLACWPRGVVARIWCGSRLGKFGGWARRLEEPGVRRHRSSRRPAGRRVCCQGPGARGE